MNVCIGVYRSIALYIHVLVLYMWLPRHQRALQTQHTGAAKPRGVYVRVCTNLSVYSEHWPLICYQ